MSVPTRPVYARVPRLRVPFVSLASLPTPVEPLKALSKETGAELWIKRDDRSHSELGGTKIRKLEFLPALADPDGRTLIAYGPHGSNWLVRIDHFGKRLGVPVRVYSFPQFRNPSARRNMARKSEGWWHRSHDPALYALSVARELPRFLGRGIRIAPMGGSDAGSTLGLVNAAFELAEQIQRGESPRPDAVFVPLGTGGVAGGLALGFALAGLDFPVVAVQITVPSIANRDRALRHAQGAARILGVPLPPLRLEVESRFFGGRYARPTAESLAAWCRFRESEGMELDHSYSAKTAAALLSRARPGERLLFWRTCGNSRIGEPSGSFPVQGGIR